MRGLASKSSRFDCRRAISVFVVGAVALTLMLMSACVPMSDGDGSSGGGPGDGTPVGQPPSGNGSSGGVPNADPPADDDEQPPLVTLSVFDVSIAASSLLVTGITIDATLTVTFETDGIEGVPRVTAARLEDVLNNFDGGLQTIGLAGGISLAASMDPPPASGVFQLQSEDGVVRGDLAAAGLSDPGLFILQPAGFTFDPGVIGVTYQVDAGSSFSFTVSGDSVDGSVNLVGTPVSAAAGTDIYTGTFSGVLRP